MKSFAPTLDEIFMKTIHIKQRVKQANTLYCTIFLISKVIVFYFFLTWSSIYYWINSGRLWLVYDRQVACVCACHMVHMHQPEPTIKAEDLEVLSYSDSTSVFIILVLWVSMYLIFCSLLHLIFFSFSSILVLSSQSSSTSLACDNLHNSNATYQ
jgi:hypothetical protein